jgi:hypothetical protein
MVVPMDAPWREYPKVVVELAAQPAFLADRTRIMVAIKHAALLLIWQSPPKANSSPAHFVQLRVMAGVWSRRGRTLCDHQAQWPSRAELFTLAQVFAD